jgi:hypothetical protein
LKERLITGLVAALHDEQRRIDVHAAAAAEIDSLVA